METIEQTKTVKRGNRKERVGTVVGDRQDKTIIVRVERKTAHPLYKKVIKKSEKHVAHDERNEARVGDTVKIVETRPFSKTKRWRLLEVVEKAR